MKTSEEWLRDINNAKERLKQAKTVKDIRNIQKDIKALEYYYHDWLRMEKDDGIKAPA